MKYIFLAAFVIATAIHLYASIREDKKLRNVSKPFILAALLGFYVMGARLLSVAVILALFFCWVGDVLLIPEGIKWFTAGGVSFMIGHGFYIAGYNRDVVFSKIPVVLIVLFSALFAGAVAFIFNKLRSLIPKALFYPVLLYLIINGAMNCFAIFRCISTPSALTVITMIGAALFFISDTANFFVRFDKESRLKTHFVVMLTYSIGELMIVLGLI